ncbi:MAG: flavin reductase family protein [Candidatus Zapsychrus exili]|nr:flavin reductase family protein [Candidatus Zapsychrus exili]
MKKSIGANTIVYPTPVFIVGTYDKNGEPNVMNAAWGGICCSNPPCVAIAVRPSRYTYENVLEKKAFTVSIPSEIHAKEADYFGIVSGRKENKLQKAGLTAVKSDIVDAPYIDEFPVALECSLLKTVELGTHAVFIGEIKDVKMEESVLGENGVPDINKIKPMVFDMSGSNYCGIGEKIADAFSVGKALIDK